MPPDQLFLTSRDQDLLEVLCRRVRMLSRQQIVRTWWSCEQFNYAAAATERLKRLCVAGFLIFRQVLARNIGELAAPVATWAPRQPTPDLGAVAWRLGRRWDIAPAVTTIYMASLRSARLFGGRRRGRIPRAFQVSHDLGVAEMFLAVRRTRPQASPLWVDEDRLAPYRRRQKLPDAVLAQKESGTPQLVLEFGAGYGKSRLLEFHYDNVNRRLPYEIW